MVLSTPGNIFELKLAFIVALASYANNADENVNVISGSKMYWKTKDFLNFKMQSFNCNFQMQTPF